MTCSAVNARAFKRTTSELRADHIDVATGCSREEFDAVSVEGDDHITVTIKEHQRSVNDIRRPCRTKEFARSTTEDVVDWPDLYSSQRLGQAGLSCTAAPHLTDDTAMSDGQLSCDV